MVAWERKEREEREGEEEWRDVLHVRKHVLIQKLKLIDTRPKQVHKGRSLPLM